MRATWLLPALLAVTALGACGEAGREVGSVSTGQQLAVEDTSYQVKAAKTASSLQNRYESVSPEGVFVVVTLQVTNTGDQGRPFNEGVAQLVTADGTQHEADPVGSGMVDMRDHLLGEGVARNFPRTGTIVFDVPPEGLEGARLRVRDLLSPHYGFVRLSL